MTQIMRIAETELYIAMSEIIYIVVIVDINI